VEAFDVLLKETSKHYDQEQLTKLTTAFDGALGDIVDQLVVNGYSQQQEYEADRLGLKYANAVGYAVSGLEQSLRDMSASSQKGTGAGFFKTHPDPSDRLAKVRVEISAKGYTGTAEAIRTYRFQGFAG
jgi:predicted Zn-dependent protease